MPMPKAGAQLSTYEADIRNETELARITSDAKPDCVIHLAAVHHIPTCEKKRSYSLEVNVVGTENMLHAAEFAKVQRFVLASSGAVYAWQDKALVEDESPLQAADNYALAKLTNEQQLAFWADRTGASLRIARIFNTIGHDDPNGHLIPDIVSQIPAGVSTAQIALGNLSPRRDYIHADDTSAAIAAIAAEAGGPSSDIFNVSTGEDVSVAELVTMLGDVMGISIDVTEDSARKRRVDRPSQLGSRSKIESRLGIRPQKSLRIALQDIVKHSTRQSPTA
jgi:UDP-glucose 4-epimerase